MLKKFYVYQLSVEFYRAGQKIKLPRHLRDQFDRASSSIALNLAEGNGKPTKKDKRKYFCISMGSLRECQAVLGLVDADSQIVALANQIGACLSKLCYPS